MASVDTTTLAYHVGRLDRAALREFVADLWAARGYETTIDDGFIRARTDTETVRIAVGGLPDGGDDVPAVDVLVAPTGRVVDGDVRILDARDLGEMLRYAIGPAAGRALCKRHFGESPVALKPSPTTRVRQRGAWIAERTPPAVLVVGAVVLLVIAGLAQLPTTSGPADANPNANVTAAPPDATPTTPVQTTSMPVPEVGPDWKSPPPGGYEQFICGAPDAPNASDLPAADCVEPVNGSG